MKKYKQNNGYSFSTMPRSEMIEELKAWTEKYEKEVEGAKKEEMRKIYNEYTPLVKKVKDRLDKEISLLAKDIELLTDGISYPDFNVFTVRGRIVKYLKFRFVDDKIESRYLAYSKIKDLKEQLNKAIEDYKKI